MNPRTTFRTVSSLVAVAIAASACGGGDSLALRTGGTPSATPPPVTLPTLPPPQERHPESFNEGGCWWDRDDWVCPATEDVTVESSPSPDALKTLRGFIGPYYNVEERSSSVEVQGSTVSAAADGAWRASGLVRNEMSVSVGQITVHAVLKTAAGAILAHESALSPVAPVRPGEPAPFEIAADVDASFVADVEWDVGVAAVSGGVHARDTEIMVDWRVPYGDRERMREDPPEGPYPFVMGGSVASMAREPIERPVVIVAWLDASGRVASIDQRPLMDIHDNATAEPLRPDDIGRFLVVEDDPSIARDLIDLEYMIWTTHRD
ncbi:MAG: hypothetical protein GEU81_06430 [Nitriliruptorales bacterium]|nr:hypothetical protein [Nitriliruptorales bacterium]